METTTKYPVLVQSPPPRPVKKQPDPEVVHNCDKGLVFRLESGKVWCTACGDVKEVVKPEN